MGDTQEVKPKPSVGEDQITKAAQPASQSDKRTGSKDANEPSAASDKDKDTSTTAPDGDAQASDKVGEEKKEDADGAGAGATEKGEEDEAKEGEEGDADVTSDDKAAKVHLDIVDELDKKIEEKPEKDWGVTNPARDAEEEENGDDKEKDDGEDGHKAKKAKTESSGDAEGDGKEAPHKEGLLDKAKHALHHDK